MHSRKLTDIDSAHGYRYCGKMSNKNLGVQTMPLCTFKNLEEIITAKFRMVYSIFNFWVSLI